MDFKNKDLKLVSDPQDIKRGRYICGVTYLSPTLFDYVMNQHKSSIVGYAYCLHDKDKDTEGNIKTPHIHFVVRLYSAWTLLQFRRWFKGFIEEKDNVLKEINTLAQFVIDKEGIVDYLTHDNEDDPNQYHYSIHELVDHGLDKILPNTSCQDDSLDIIEALNSGVPLRELTKRYGRNFVYHFSQYQYLALQIKEQESVKTNGPTQWSED